MTASGCNLWQLNQSLPRNASPCKSELTTSASINDGITLTLPDSLAKLRLKRHSEHPESGYVYLLGDQIMISIAVANPPDPYVLFARNYLSHSHDLQALSDLGMHITLDAKELEEGRQRRSSGGFNSVYKYYRLRSNQDRFIMALRGQKTLDFHIADSQRYYSVSVSIGKQVDQQTCDAYLDSLECNLDVVFNSVTSGIDQESNLSK